MARHATIPRDFYRILCLVLAGMVCWFAFAASRVDAGPEIPGAEQTRPIALVGATVHTVSGKVIKEGTVLFVDGQIAGVGKNLDHPQDTQVVDVTGKHVYPGLFNTDGSLGLLEINSVRATLDYSESGDFNPNVRAEIAVNPDSTLIPVTRSGGVLLNLTAPSGGRISGRSAVLQLDGWTWEDMTLKAPAGMHLNWPSLRSPEHHDSHDAHASKQTDQQLAEIVEIFDQATAYDKARSADPEMPIDVKWEAMRGVLHGEIPLVVLAEGQAEIEAAVSFASQRKLRIIIEGGYDAVKCAELLKSQNVPVIVGGVYRLPRRRNDPYDHAFTLPARLKAADVPFCIAGSARFDASNIRNLPYHAAMAIAFGLDPRDALRAITLSPAEIVGIADRVGSLEVGKDATLIVTDGDVFDSATHVVDAYVQGRRVDLSNRHTRLYEKYETRLKRETKK